jgi:hypothetical protein
MVAGPRRSSCERRVQPVGRGSPACACASRGRAPVPRLRGLVSQTALVSGLRVSHSRRVERAFLFVISYFQNQVRGGAIECCCWSGPCGRRRGRASRGPALHLSRLWAGSVCAAALSLAHRAPAPPQLRTRSCIGAESRLPSESSGCVCRDASRARPLPARLRLPVRSTDVRKWRACPDMISRGGPPRLG